MHFDDLNPGEPGSEVLWIDSSLNNIALTNTNVGPFTSATLQSNPDFVTSRFGPAFAYFFSGLDVVEYAEKGGVLSERTTALNLGSEWTIEFWFYVRSDDWPETKPFFPWCMLSMDREDKDGCIGFDILWTENNGQIIGTFNSFFKEKDLYQYRLEGNQVSTNTWHHVAMVRSGDAIKLFQNGNAVSFQAWTGLEIEQVNRVGLGGLTSSDSDQIKNWNCAAGIDELRILTDKAAYDINAQVIEIPTGPVAE